MTESRINLAFVDSGQRKAPFFLELRHYLEPEFRCLYYSRRVMVRGYVRSAKAPLFPDARPCTTSYGISDDELRLAIGKKEMVKNGPKALRRAPGLLADLSAFFDAQKIDAILVWNGTNLLVSLAVYLARQRGMPVIFAEHGYLPGTTQIDRSGVNFDSSVTALVASGVAQLPPDPEIDLALDQTIAAYKTGAPMRVLDAAVPARFKSDFRSSLYRNLVLWGSKKLREKMPDVGLDFCELPPRYLLLPFQVQKDSQLILHSPLVGNDMARLLTLVHAALKSVDSGMKIVVKLHPRERWDRQSRYAELVRQFPDVLFVRKHRMTELLEKAAAVVTINSSVGFEAFLYDKPVVALGRNFYTAPGMVEAVDQPEQLPEALRRALTQPVEVQRRRAMLRYVNSRFLTFGSYDNHSEGSLRAVAERVRALLTVPAPVQLQRAGIEA